MTLFFPLACYPCETTAPEEIGNKKVSNKQDMMEDGNLGVQLQSTY
jgi:hypothetical protein